MTSKEKRLLSIFVLIFIGYALPFEVWPRAFTYYEQYRQNIEKLNADIAHYRNLGANADHWQEQNRQEKQKRDEILASLLEGNSQDVVAARVQGLLRELAQNAGVTLKSLNVAEFSRTRKGDWVLVTQTMQFEANSVSAMNLLQAIEKAKEMLFVTNLDIRNSSSGTLSGTIKVTGFSRVTVTTAITQ
ncbi:MAG: hypothetical protein BWK79_05800 [Beggiatoa sp. IS2]|nr:MAG: hypothetical protein BWK79_05800 [Beggiatoa sp. IS2]